jgi:drug/metabolite transporter (DMT)-like permease
MLLFLIDRLSGTGTMGNGLAVLSGISFAALICILRLQKAGSPIGSIVLGNILTAVFSIPWMMHPMTDSRSWLCLVLLGIFQIGLSYALFSEAIRHVSALEGILVPVIEPVLNPVWVILVVGETPGRWSLLGGLIVITSVLIHSWMTVRIRKRK